MALDKTSMATFIKNAIALVDSEQFGSIETTEEQVLMDKYRDAILEAMCAGIIEEITTNAVVSIDTGSSEGTYGVS